MYSNELYLMFRISNERYNDLTYQIFTQIFCVKNVYLFRVHSEEETLS